MTHATAMQWFNEQPHHSEAYLAPTVLALLRQAGARRVLDLGCGNGALTLRLAAAGFSMTGLDGSSTGIAIARANAAGLASFHEGWLEDVLPHDLHKSFDAVIAVEVIEHLPRPRVLCERAREALRGAGPFIVTTPYHGYFKNLALALCNRFDRHWHPWVDGGHIKFFSPTTLGHLLESEGFAVRRLAREGRIPIFAKSMIIEAARSR